ncbi:hypothetical protein JMJ77_0008804 [Colletotrichum scovillei]|uniref:Uncharacterized protein n=1 Tax=Colletotrichum scovillei TaxID=1209932 RepID=A0A9P7QRV8_9PEZI|nr:hypothetical protein JMJ78_0001661 [Colletotrichum scovillei]KAG7041099.1 hypothetical protein JMJ77_0008804 [Colletotrichum scovillei]KAG7061132.1 hypothetical protein JMJ76_0010202 [Colletotrichum scovillei]
MPHPPNSHYEEQVTFEDPRSDYLGYAAPRYDRDNYDDDQSHGTQSYNHWPPGPSYWETTHRARLPAHYLPSPWRDAHRSRLRHEREERTETPFEIIPSIENNEQSSPVFPETQWASDSSWASLPTPASEIFTLRSQSFSDNDSISELHHHRHPQNHVPDYRNSSAPDATPAPTARSVSITTSAHTTRSSTRLAVPPQSSGGQPAPSGQDTDPSRCTGLAG